MGTEIENVCLELRLANDPRLFPAVSCAAERLAGHRGLSPAASLALGEAAEQACRDSFARMDDADVEAAEQSVGVVVQNFPDRIEITIEHTGEAGPAAGLDTFGVFGGGASGSGLALLSRVDRVQYQGEKGVSRMTLVKYVPPAA